MVSSYRRFDNTNRCYSLASALRRILPVAGASESGRRPKFTDFGRPTLDLEKFSKTKIFFNVAGCCVRVRHTPPDHFGPAVQPIALEWTKNSPSPQMTELGRDFASCACPGGWRPVPARVRNPLNQILNGNDPLFLGGARRTGQTPFPRGSDPEALRHRPKRTSDTLRPIRTPN